MEKKSKKNKVRLLMMCGVPGSGKSTLAKEIHNKCEIAYVSRDEIRYMLLKSGQNYFDNEKKVRKIFIKMIKTLLENGVSVIADATHLTIKAREAFLWQVSVPNMEKMVIVCNTPLRLALERNKQRTGHARVPEQAILDMYERFEIPTILEGFDTVVTVRPKERK